MLKDILGQPYAVRVLKNALDQDRLAGSYLFVGPDGVGKATAARQFAKRLCGSLSDDDATAKAIDAGRSPDVRTVLPRGSNTYRIAQLWPRDDASTKREFPPEDALLRDLHFEPMAGLRRVFIIESAEALNPASGNSLLKSLEEPPAYANFILTTPSTGNVLPTIVSRCQVVHFGLLPAEDIENALTTRFGVAPAQARFLAAYSEGRLGRAVSLARSPSLLAGRELLLDLARDLTSAPPIKSFKLGEEFRKLAPKLKASEDDESAGEVEEKAGREPLGRALDLLAIYYRDVLAVTVLGDAKASLVNIDRREEIAEAADRYSSAQMQRALALLLDIRQCVERNANTQLAIDVLFTHLTTLGKKVEK